MTKIQILVSSILFCVLTINARAAVIKGHVLDSNSHEPLTGAVVFDKDSNRINATAGLDGGFVIKNIAPGKYTFVAQFFGYITLEKTVTVTDANKNVVLNFLMKAQSVNLGQVKVAASYEKESDSYARSLEKHADYVMNVISAKTIQLLPDITIGDVLQRVSGVVAEKSVTGGGKYATIRGMDKRYNYTCVNGIEIPSPDYKNRFVPMDIFPAELVQRLEVIKSLTPDIEGDAIGGAMNLILKDAPENFSLTATIATGYNQTLFNRGYNKFDVGAINSKSPAELNGPAYMAKITDFPLGNITYKDVTAPANILGGFTIGNRFFKKKLGVMFSASYQNIYNATYGFFLKPQSQPNFQPTYNTPVWDYMQGRYYSVQDRRGAAHLMMDYMFNSKHHIKLYSLYTEMDQFESRVAFDTNNTAPGSELDPEYQSKVIYQHIYNTTLIGTDSLLHNLCLDWTGAYSKAWANQPDWTTLQLYGVVGSPTTTFSQLTRAWMHNSDQDVSGYINLTYKLRLLGQNIEFKAGAMNRDKTRNAYYNEYNIYATVPQPPFVSVQDLFSNPLLYSFKDGLGSPESNNTYSVQEDVMAYYGMTKFTIGPRIQIIGGMRVENTNQAYQDGEPETIPGKDGTKQYTDYLPSAEVKYKINEKMAVRAGYFASIARPSYFEIVPYQMSGQYYTEVGNPELKHSQANNYDLRYEFFPKPSDQILLGIFYKQIFSPIESVIGRGTGPSSTLVRPVNIGGDTNPAINYGFEFVYTKYFLRHFGISANYTYTHSRITVPEYLYEAAPGGGNRLVDTTEKRPMQGQVDHIGNLSFIYKDSKLGIEAEIAGVYTGKSVAYVSYYYGLELWQMPAVKLDFSFEKRLSKKLKLSLYGKVNNLLNTPLTLRMFPPNRYANIPNTPLWLSNQDSNNGELKSIVTEKEYYGQTYLIGIRYKF